MGMPFVDLQAQLAGIEDKVVDGLKAVLGHGAFIMGPEIGELETRLAEYCGVNHAVACSSGTDALLMALLALGVKAGDAVLLPPFTFIATAEVVALLGAVPVFVDIEAETFNIDPGKLEQAVSALKADPSKPNPKAVIPVDLFGLPADYDRIQAVADAHGLAVIEDAAQSFGGEYKGRKACSLADMACTSFFPAKPLGAYGDGGMCFTDDPEAAEAMRSLLNHGMGGDRYDHVRIGINGRLDSMQAAVLLAKFDIFPGEAEARNRVASRYAELLQGAPGLALPATPRGSRSIWAQYTILAADGAQREAVRGHLQANGVPTAIYYPKPLHLQPAFSHLGGKPGDFPVSEDSSARVFSLPMHPYLSEEDQERVAALVRQAVG